VILVDTSLWVDHFKHPDPGIALLMAQGDLVRYPFVTGELAVGTLHPRHRTILLLRSLPQLDVATEDVFYEYMDEHDLAGRGMGFVDIHLLIAASASGARLWTRDQRLMDNAARVALRLADG
jgi:predicted nucleic acid-binding protein